MRAPKVFCPLRSIIVSGSSFIGTPVETRNVVEGLHFLTCGLLPVTRSQSYTITGQVRGRYCSVFDGNMGTCARLG